MATKNIFSQSPFDNLLPEDAAKALTLPGQEPVKPQALPAVEAPQATQPQTSAPDTRQPSASSNLMPPPAYRPIFEAAAREFDVPVNVLMALGHQESRYNPRAIGPETQWGRARGMMQYLDGTAKGLGINPFSPEESIPAAARQLRERLDKGYSMEDAVKEHFAGPDRKLWGAKTAAYGREVMQKVGQIGEALGTEQSAQYDGLQQQLDQQEPGRFRVIRPGDDRLLFRLQENFDAEMIAKGGLGQQGKPEDDWDKALREQQEKADNRPFFERLGEGVTRGYDNTVQFLSTARYAMGAGGDSAELAEALANKFEAERKRKKTTGEQEIDAAFDRVTDAKGAWNTTVEGLKAIGTAFSNPKDLAIGIAEQAPNMLPTLGTGAAGAGGGAAVGSVAGPGGAITGAIIGGRAGMAVGTTATELGAEIEETLLERLATDKKAPTASNIKALLDDAKFISEARERGLKKGLTIAAVDQIFFSLTGKVAGKAVAAKTVAGKAGYGTGAVALDAAGETIGEAASQKVARGEVDAGDALREGVYGLGQSVVEPVISAGARGAKEARDALRPEPAQPAPRVDPTMDGGSVTVTVPQPDGTTQTATVGGPLSRALEGAADSEAQRVSVTTPEGQIAGFVESYQEDGQGGFAARILGDDGQTYNFTSADQVTITPEAAKPGPLTSSIETAAETLPPAAPAAPVVPAVDLAPAPDSAAPAQAPAALPTVELATMDEPALRERLKYIAEQAKINGGWNPMLMQARREVEREINQRAKPVEPAAQKPLAEPPAASTAPKLPRELAGAKGRYNFGKKAFDLNFESDVDFAAYITAQANQSARDADYLKFAMQATGMSEAEVRAHGQKVRDAIKAQARDAEPGTLNVPTVPQGEANVRESQVPEVPAASGVSVQPTDGPSKDAAPAAAGRQPGVADNGGNAGAQDKPAALKPASKEDLDRLFGIDKKREKARERIAAGKAWFNDGVKAKDFITKNGLKDTHEVVKGKGGRFEIQAKGQANGNNQRPVGQPDGAEAARETADAGQATSAAVQPDARPDAEQGQVAPRRAGIAGEDAPGARDSLLATLNNPNVPVLDANGFEKPEWTELPNGFAYRQYVLESEDGREAFQEVRAPKNGRREPPIAIRGLTANGKTFGELEAAGTIEEVLSGKAFEDFSQYFDGQKPAGLLRNATAPKAVEAASAQEAQAGTRVDPDEDSAAPQWAGVRGETVLKGVVPRGKRIGVNPEGNAVYEDDSGTRSVVENGYTVIESDADNRVAEFNIAKPSEQDPIGTTPPPAEKMMQPDWWTALTPNERYRRLQASGIQGTAQTPWNRLNAADQRALNEQWGGQNDELDAEMRSYEAKAEAAERAKAKPAVSANTIFTEDAADKARALLKRKLTQLNSGIDPEIMQAGITLAGYHIEKGARTFAAYARAMVEDLGDVVQPYLKSWYMGVKYDPRASAFDGMSSAAEVEEADVNALLETPAQAPTMAQGEQDAGTVQTENVPARRTRGNQADAAAGDGNRQQMGLGLGEDGQGTAEGGAVSGRAEGAGARGTRTAEQSGAEPSGAARDSAGVRTEPGAAASDADFVIDAEDIGKGGLTKKYRDNVAAIRILKTIESEGRVATPDERKQLAKYVGWGAMKGPFDPENKQWAKQHAELKELLTPEEFRAARKSTLDAHYTSPVAISAMNAALERLGYRGGRMLEPSVGVGNFLGLMPAAVRNASQMYGVELDSLTSRMVAALYPKAKIAKATGFEDFQIPAGFFDLVQGNPPFGSQPLVDAERSPYSGFSIHNYFLAKGIDKLRPGGLMEVVVSHNFLDAQDSRARKWIAERADLVGAVRLPNTAFQENAGTSVVTDILIFQKREPGAAPKDVSWTEVSDQTNTNPKTGESATHKVNRYFLDNPQFVLGTPSAGGSMYRANEYTVEANGNLKAQLDGWVQSLPEALYAPIERAPEAITDMAVPDGVKVGSYYVDANGEIMQRGEDVLGNKTASAWTAPNAKAAERMKGMIALRETLRTQMRLERSPDATQAEIDANRATLNRQYDDFLKKHGHINSPTNRRLFLDDTESQLIQALEFDYDKGISRAVAEREGIDPKEPSATKADIFKRRVAFPPQDFLTVTTAKDALLASLNYRGKVDPGYMAEVYGKPMEKIVEELGDVVYDDPQAGIVTADEYLSGDVKTKLAEARAAAQGDAKYQRNVEALEKVIPADKKPSEISVSIGAAFVPSEVYEQFVKQISGGEARAAYVKATGQWLMDFKGTTEPALNTGKFGTDQLSAQDLFQLSMLGRGAVVKKTLRNPDGTTTTILLEKETEAAREKQNAIKAEWQSWLWSDPARADQIASIYNDKMNRIVERKYDGAHMTFPGMNPAINLLAHQKNGVWRGLQSYQVLYDHVVGAGKTFEMATLAMEMRRLGISRKPLFVVPNHLTLQWRSEFTRLYPGSNVLAATPEDFSKDNRERLFSKIITGDWDAVVVGHSSLKKIGLPEETEKAVLQEQIDEVATAIEDMKRQRGDRNIIRDMEGIRSRLEARMKDKLSAIGKRSKVVTFDELGIDAMFIDEMHEFKNLAYNSTMDRNPGMGNPNGSAKAFDLFVKTRWLFDTFGDKTPYITATGTPVSNSLVEMYNMQRYMQYPTLKREGLHVFDAWAKQFGNVENVYEVAPSGSGYRQSTRFAKFSNLPALMSLYNSFADTITLDDLKAQEQTQGKRFPVPKLVGGKPQIVVAQRSPAVSNLMGVPTAQTNDDGSIKFLADLGGAIQIDQKPDTGKWTAKVGESYLGEFDTEQDARLKIVERALTPEVSVDPESILGRFGRLKQLTKETKGKVNALSLTGEANKAGLDYRLIDPAAPDFAGSKINLAVDNMARIYRQWNKDKGAQLVFCDLSIPLSARASFSSKARRLYVRDEAGAVEMKRGTMHTLEGQESLPYFVVQRGEKDLKRFDVYDAVSGVKIGGDFRTKPDAIEQSNALLADDTRRQRWIDRREAMGELSQEAIDEYNNENDIEADGIEAFTREDIAGVSGAAKFSVYDDIKAKLIAKGIPEREIAFIHDYSTPTAKDKLFKAVNSGEIRFLLGSTPKMGAGTNVQKRLVGLHHIDAPWRPSDLEQREGRIIRRGNELYERDPDGFEVFIGRYATEQTYDTRRWQILEHKARGIEQLRNFDGSINEIDDIEGEAANAADMKAAASGDPLILEETRLKNDVRRLEQLQAAHADDVLSLNRKAKAAEEFAKTMGPRRLAELTALDATAKKNPLDKEGFAPVAVNGKTFTTKEAAQDEIGRASSTVRAGLQEEATVVYRGLEFNFMRNGATLIADSPTGTLGTWSGAEAFSPSGFLQRMKNYADRLPSMGENTRAEIAKAEKDAAAMREQAKAPFAQAAELETTREEYKRVQRALLAKGPAVPDSQKPAVAAGIEAQKNRLREIGFGEALDEFFASTQDAPRYSVAPESDGQMPELRVDVPNERWLQQQIDYAKQKDRDRWGVPYMGKVTASFRGKPVNVPVSILVRLKGQRGEQNNVRTESLDYIRANWDKVIENPPYIKVAYNGEAWVSEGNHRIMVAAERGETTVPVEIRYFDGGERAAGPLNPDDLARNYNVSPRYSVNANGTPEAEFGPVYTGLDAEAAIARLMDEEAGEAIVTHPQLGEISIVYGDRRAGLQHIAARRGDDILSRLPDLLADGELYTKPGQENRVFIGNDRDEAVIRLDWNGQAKTWLLSAYEKYPDLKAGKAAKVSRRSQTVSERTEAGLTVDQARAAITQGAIGPVIAKMIDNDLVVLHASAKTLPKGVGGNVRGIQAVTTPDGMVHMVASRVTRENARAVLLHEMFHRGGERLIGSTEWGKLMGRMGSLYRQSEQSTGRAREFFDRARDRVAAAKRQNAVSTRMEVEEFAAYAIEEYERAPESLPAAIRKWVEDLIGLVKAWVQARYGKQLGKVTPAQLAALAKLAVMDMAADYRGEMFGQLGMALSVADPVSSPAFKRWFGNSKVVDKQGRPLIVYHGGHFEAATFEAFDPALTDESNDLGAGFYFSSSKLDAEGYDYNQEYGDPQTLAVYLSITNPYVIGETKKIKGHESETGEDFRQAVEAAGYDGIIDRTVNTKFADEDYKPDATHYVAFRPEQIKSAIVNNGDFDPTNPDIRYSVSPDQAEKVIEDADKALDDTGLIAKDDYIGRVVGDLSLGAKMIVHPRTVAAVHPEFTPVYNTAISQMETRDEIIADLGKDVRAYDQLNQAGKDNVNKALELGRLTSNVYTAEQLSRGVANTGTRKVVVIGEDGKPKTANVPVTSLLTQPGEVITLTGEEIAAYQGLRVMFDRALDMMRDQTLEELGFAELAGKPDAAKAIRELITNNTPAEQAETLRNIAKFVAEIEQAKRAGYVPLSRYGDYVVTVKEKVASLTYEPDGEGGYLIPDAPASMAEDLLGLGAVQTEGRWRIKRDQKKEVERLTEQTVYSAKIETGLKDFVGSRKAKTVEDIPAVRDAIEKARSEWVGDNPARRIVAFRVRDKKPDAPVRLSDVDALAEVANIDNATWDAVRDKLADAIKSRSFRKHFFHSDNVPGYTGDFERSVSDYVIGMAGYLSRRQHIKRWDNAVSGITDKPKLAEYASKYRQYVNDPQEELAIVRQIGFFAYIAGVAATAFANVTQVPMLAVPTLSQVAPTALVLKETARAYKDALKMLGRPSRVGLDMFDPNKAPADVRDALKEAWDEGAFVPLETFDLMMTARQRNVGARKGVKAFNKTTQVVSIAFTFAERLNRLVTFMAAARLANKRAVQEKAGRVLAGDALARQTILGKNWSPKNFAEWAVDESQYRMGKANRPTMMRGVGTAIMQFKGFMLQTFEAWYRMAALHGKEGRYAALASLASVMAIGGVWGLPGADDLRKLIEAIYRQLTDRDLDLKTELRAWVARTSGSNAVSQIVTKGATYPLGVDMTRVGFGSVVPDSPLSAAGIPFDLAVGRPKRAFEKASSEDYIGAAAEFTPNFVKNVLVAGGWALDGVRDKRGSRILTPDELTMGDMGMRAMGFQPSIVTDVRDYEYAQRRQETAVDALKRSYTNKIAKVIGEMERTGDPAKLKELDAKLGKLYAEIDKHNATADPEEMIEIGQRAIRNRVARELDGVKSTWGRERKAARGAAEDMRGLFGLQEDDE